MLLFFFFFSCSPWINRVSSRFSSFLLSTKTSRWTDYYKLPLGLNKWLIKGVPGALLWTAVPSKKMDKGSVPVVSEYLTSVKCLLSDLYCSIYCWPYLNTPYLLTCPSVIFFFMLKGQRSSKLRNSNIKLISIKFENISWRVGKLLFSLIFIFNFCFLLYLTVQAFECVTIVCNWKLH